MARSLPLIAIFFLARVSLKARAVPEKHGCLC